MDVLNNETEPKWSCSRGGRGLTQVDVYVDTVDRVGG